MSYKNPEVEESVRKQYVEMKKSGVSEEACKITEFSSLTLYVNDKPEIVFSLFTFETDTVYLGSN